MLQNTNLKKFELLNGIKINTYLLCVSGCTVRSGALCIYTPCDWTVELKLSTVQRRGNLNNRSIAVD